MEKLEKLYEGKAKQLYATDDPEVLWSNTRTPLPQVTAKRRKTSPARAG